MARLLIWCLGWMQVHWSEKSSCWKQFLEQWGAKQGSDYHVTTLERCDAPTSRRWVNNAEVNKWKRRDVPTSRRLNVATLQRRDVSSRSAPHHLKYEWLRNQGIGRRTNEGTKFHSRVTQTLKKCPRFVLFLIFGYENNVFNTKHFHLFIQYVLDLFLGLY